MFTHKAFSWLWQTSDQAGAMIARAVKQRRYWATTWSVRILVWLAPFLPVSVMRYLLNPTAAPKASSTRAY